MGNRSLGRYFAAMNDPKIRAYWLQGREGTARDIQASGPSPGSAEVTLTCKVVAETPQGNAIESPPPTLCQHGFVLADNICGPCSEGRPNRATSNNPGGNAK